MVEEIQISNGFVIQMLEKEAGFNNKDSAKDKIRIIIELIISKYNTLINGREAIANKLAISMCISKRAKLKKSSLNKEARHATRLSGSFNLVLYAEPAR